MTKICPFVMTSAVSTISAMPAEEYTYITHLINQQVGCNDDSQWYHQAIHSVLSERVLMPPAWCCIPSSLNQGKRYWKREVIVVGVFGASGAGKTSLCRRLSYELNSPFEAISTDWYLRRESDLPPCPHHAADPNMQWCQDRCYELPCCYDLNALHDELLTCVSHVAQCKTLNLHPYHFRTPRTRRRRLRPAGEWRDNVPSYIIVEGFILLAEPAIVHQLTKLVWLHVPWDISFTRRCKRAGRISREEYKEHVDEAHRCCLNLYRRNVADRDVHEIDATGDADVVYGKVFACLTDPPGQDIESCVDSNGHCNNAVIDIESDSASDVAPSVGPSVGPLVTNVSSQLRMPNGAVIEVVALAADASAAALEAAVATSLSLSLSLPHLQSPNSDISDDHAC